MFFVFSTNGHLFVAYDEFLGKTTEESLLESFPSPEKLRKIYEKGKGLSLKTEPSRALFMPYQGGQSERRYYQDAAIRAALEKIASQKQGWNRVLLSLATGSGKTRIAVQLLHKLEKSGQLKRALFVCDRNELKRQGYGSLFSIFGDNAVEFSKNKKWQNARLLVATYQSLGLDDSDDAFPIALANLALHGIDFPHIGLKNTLSGRPTYVELFQGAPSQFDYILTNPPFGGKEGEDAKTSFAYKTGSTQVLFLQHIIDKLKDGGTCAMVIDEGVLFRTNETSFVQTKRKLLEECDLWCILSLPQNVFVNAGAGVKTNLLFFTKGKQTKKVWYYDMSDIKVRKKLPFTLDKFNDFFTRFSSDKDKDKISDKSWFIDIETIKNKNYDIKAVNPNIKEKVIPKPEELIKIIEESQAKINKSLKMLKEIN